MNAIVAWSDVTHAYYTGYCQLLPRSAHRAVSSQYRCNMKPNFQSGPAATVFAICIGWTVSSAEAMPTGVCMYPKRAGYENPEECHIY